MKTKIKQVVFAFAILSVFSLGFFTNASNASAQYAVPTCNSATLNGTVIPNGVSTMAWFQWGQGSSLGNATDPLQNFTTTQAYSQTIYNLQENTTYSFRAMASDINGKTATGQTLTFTTSSCGGTVNPPASNPTATINSTASCTAPCNVQISWTSDHVASTINFYRNGTFIWNQQPNMSGSQTDWAVAQGTYRYCVRAIGADWHTETGDLDCSTTTVTSAAVIPPAQNPSATISSTASCTAPCNVAVNWSSSSVANPPNIVQIYKDGIPLWTDAGNASRSNTDYGVGVGSHTYCIRADNADWSITGNLNCSTTVVTTAVTPPQSVMSGTLTPDVYSCFIQSGQNNCGINFTWKTINPVAISAVTSAGVTVANGNSTSGSFAIPFGSKTFYLYNNSILLDQKTVSASCTTGTTWNGGVCQASTAQTCQDPSANNYGGALPCTYTTTQTCQDPTASNYHGTLPCTYPPQVCQDTAALNYHGTLPCRYSGPTCQDTSATNYGGTPPCTYAPQVCQDTAATNYHGTLPCRYSQATSGSAGTNFVFGASSNTSTNTNTNTGGTSTNTNNNTSTGGTSTNTNTNNNNPVINVNVNGSGGLVQQQTCQDGSATNYGGILPCNYYHIQTCQDPSATNYRGTLPCQYYNNVIQTCQDPSAINYRGILPCTYYSNVIQT